MSKTIHGLYKKYNKKMNSLEDDEFFQYLFDKIAAGKNDIQFLQQTLHKELDCEWLIEIENSLPSINKVIEKPRKFIKTVEEVVPVELAKKISSDSVRHLSQNTQFIAYSDENNIHPTKILNVSNEETYDLYENRFIYHLIQRLITFIDRRTDIIFWMAGDEVKNVIQMNSKIKNQDEDIEYKLEIKVNNHKTFAESAPDNMDLFLRIDKLRKNVLALNNSPFCKLMKGCSKVRSPIQRTNLLTKNPDYKKCYQLWQFLERYDDVGYSINIKNSNIEFDQEYLIQMYVNLIGNYVSFKSLLEDDGINLNKIQARKTKTLKPKFVKKIEDEIVDDYNIPNVEKRQVIVEEVTQKQLEVEKINAELIEIAKQKDEEINTLNTKINQLLRQLDKQNELVEQEIEKHKKEYTKELTEKTILFEEEMMKASTQLKENDTKLKNLKSLNEVLQNDLDKIRKENIELKYLNNVHETEKKKQQRIFDKYSELKNSYTKILLKNEKLVEENIRLLNKQTDIIPETKNVPERKKDNIFKRIFKISSRGSEETN